MKSNTLKAIVCACISAVAIAGIVAAPELALATVAITATVIVIFIV